MVYSCPVFMNCLASGIAISLMSYVGLVISAWILILLGLSLKEFREWIDAR
ncbi:MAG: hypothetical protein WC926_03590 [Candidatus Paceibacterota bacterium]|jgi:hypothetical protein